MECSKPQESLKPQEIMQGRKPTLKEKLAKEGICRDLREEVDLRGRRRTRRG